MSKARTISDYLIEQLLRRGVAHVFGVPGDYVLTFMKQVERSRLKLINTSDEQGAGFAADAYGRLRGLGVVCVTYGVGALKIVNTTAEAFSEQSPVVVISGAPGVREQGMHPLLHHKVREFETQHRIFEHITVASAVLNNPETACYEIDRVLDACDRFKQPVYIEIPRDMPLVRCRPSRRPLPPRPASDPAALCEVLAEAAPRINGARRPVFIIGNEVHRFGLEKAVTKLIEKTGIPYVSLVQSKSVLTETHPLFLGVYEGGMGRKDLREYVEGSDCLILLGGGMNDINLGIFTAKLDPRVSIFAARERISIAHHHFPEVTLEDFIAGLKKARLKKRGKQRLPRQEPPGPFRARENARLSVRRLFECLNAFIQDHHVIIADIGDALFGGADLYVRRHGVFLASAYYASLGFSVPAALGVQLARPKSRPIVLVGDGAFQMTGMELSTAARFGLNPIVVLLNNRGYGTERPMTEGKFNDLQNWRYSRLPEVLGAGRGQVVRTEDQLEFALRSAERSSEFTILDVHLEQGDFSPALKRLTSALGREVRAAKRRA
jgi:indolepyruvate decarboxylase